MRLFSNEHIFQRPWSAVSTANWIKYPSEMTPHVIHVDYISRHVDPLTGILHTERLLTCCQNGPAFIHKIIGGQNVSYVYERSEVDPNEQSLVLRAQNLSLSHLINVEEVCRYSPFDAERTRFQQEARFTTFTGWSYIREQLEDFCISRMKVNAAKGRLALEHVLDKIYVDTKEQILERLGAGHAPPLANAGTENDVAAVSM